MNQKREIDYERYFVQIACRICRSAYRHGKSGNAVELLEKVKKAATLEKHDVHPEAFGEIFNKLEFY